MLVTGDARLRPVPQRRCRRMHRLAQWLSRTSAPRPRAALAELLGALIAETSPSCHPSSEAGSAT